MPNNILIGIGAGIVAIIIAVIAGLAISNAHLKTEIATLQINNAACHVINGDFKMMLDRQNAAVNKLAADAQRRAATMALAMKKATAQAGHYRHLASHLMQQKSSPDECQAVKEIVDDYWKP